MPIRLELREFYRKEHRALRARLIAACGFNCWECGREWKRYLNLAHASHDPKDWQSVRLWCPPCHARHDARHSRGVRRRTVATRDGQLWILGEIEWATEPLWRVPEHVLAEAQLVLFPEPKGKLIEWPEPKARKELVG